MNRQPTKPKMVSGTTFQSSMGARIQRRRTALGISQRKLGEEVGVSHQSIQQWERGAVSPRGMRLEALARVLRTSSQWLLASKGPEVTDFGNAQISGPAQHYMPILPWQQLAKLGPGIAIEDIVTGNEEQIGTDREVSSLGFATRVLHDRMSPELTAGCLAIVDPALTAKGDDFVLVFLPGEPPTLGQLLRDAGVSRLRVAEGDSGVMPFPAAATMTLVIVESRKTYR